MRESNEPNSTLDASRMVGTIKALLGSSIDNHGKFLDVACGYGFFSKCALNAGFDVVALEPAQNERKIASELTGLSPYDCAFEAFEYQPESFAVVLMSQILEHVFDVNQWIAKARELLVSGGILAIALPNYGSFSRRIMQENEPYITPPAHLNYFNPKSLSALLTNHGFQVENIQQISRVPKSAIEKHIPSHLRGFLPAFNLLSSQSCKVFDFFRLGMMINVYARKI